ncbi:MAG: CapA family protein [bacterium]|nr:CapA family protein [bacterium]
MKEQFRYSGDLCIPLFPALASRNSSPLLRRITVIVAVVGLVACSSGQSREGGTDAVAIAAAAAFHPAFTSKLSKAEADAQKAGSIKLLFAGDTHFQWGVADLQQAEGRMAPLAALAPVFHAADFRVVNLETSISDRGQPFVRKSYIFNTPPENISVLQNLKLDLALLGNNHSMDMGRVGLERTLRALRRAGIASVGSGPDSAQAPGPFLFSRGGVRFAVLSYSGIGEASTFSTRSRPGVANMSDLSIYQRVRAARRVADQVIVSLHWGNEYYPRADRKQIKFARALIDAGATAIIGHHPHVPQGIEVYRGRVICYSLGNFLFGSINEDQTHNIMAQLEVDPKSKQIDRVRIMPVLGRYRDTGNHRLRLLDANEAGEFWEEFYVLVRDLSRPTVKKLRVYPDGSGTISVR